MRRLPLNKGGGAERRRSRSARGLSVRLSYFLEDNPLEAERPLSFRLLSPFVKGEFFALQ
jgi:hypothetical protein